MEGEYTRKRFIEILGLEDERLRQLEGEQALAARGGPRDTYPVSDLSAYREALDIYPPDKPLRRQLFLNFKGGTGKNESVGQLRVPSGRDGPSGLADRPRLAGPRVEVRRCRRRSLPAHPV